MTTEPRQGRPEVMPDGHIADFISGLPVRATAEEVDAVQGLLPPPRRGTWATRAIRSRPVHSIG